MKLKLIFYLLMSLTISFITLKTVNSKNSCSSSNPANNVLKKGNYAPDSLAENETNVQLRKAELSLRYNAPDSVELYCKKVLDNTSANRVQFIRAYLIMGDSRRIHRQYDQANRIYMKALALAEAPPNPHEAYRLAIHDRLVNITKLKQGEPELSSTVRRVERISHPALTLYVAPNGNDNNSGTEQNPFASLEAAQDAIRQFKIQEELPLGGIEVVVRAGLYFRDRPFVLTEEDSGTETSPIIYRSAPNETPRLVGGICVSGFKPVTDQEVLKRIPCEAHGNVMQVNLKEAGILNYGNVRYVRSQEKEDDPPAGLELFFNKLPMQMARYPNEGWERVHDLVGTGHPVFRGVPAEQEGRFIYNGIRLGNWAAEHDIWLCGYWATPFWAENIKIASIDTVKKIIQTAPTGKEQNWKFVSFGFCQNWPFFVYNALCELDAPGEWYLDREQGVLYFWPPTPAETGEALVSILSRPLIEMKEASHVVFQGFILEASRGFGVNITGGTDCMIAGCIIRNVGRWAIKINGGQKHQVVGCDITETGDGGIDLGGGDRRSLKPADHLIENNHIWRYGRYARTYRCAVKFRKESVGIRVAHNLIHDAPTLGMMIYGNDNVLEYNEIHDVLYEASEGGTIYMGQDWSMRGNVARYNYIHHISKEESPHKTHGSRAFHVDDYFSGFFIFGNVFFRIADSPAIYIGGGRDNVVENNIFVDCYSAVGRDARGMKMSQKENMDTNYPDRLNEMPYFSSPWSDRYPQLQTLFDDDRGIPKGTVVTRNINMGPRFLSGFSISQNDKPLPQEIEWRTEIINNWNGKDPGFVNHGLKKFQLREDSPVYNEIGFEDIPLNDIGLYADPLRASWPVVHNMGEHFHCPSVDEKAVLLERKKPNYLITPILEQIKIDGDINPGEWGLDRDEAVPELLLAETKEGKKSKQPGTAWIVADSTNLYIGIKARIPEGKKLTAGNIWDESDGVEISFQPVYDAEYYKGPTFILRGFIDGRFKSSYDAGAPKAYAEALGSHAQYAAKTSKTEWTAEWKIPMEVIGITNLWKLHSLLFNVVIKGGTYQGDAMVWHAGGINTWDFGKDAGGILILR